MATDQTTLLVLNFARSLILDFAMVSQFFLCLDFSLFGLDTSRKLLLLVKLFIRKIGLFLSHRSLTGFRKQILINPTGYLYFKSKPSNTYWNKFFNHNQEQFMFWFPLDNVQQCRGRVSLSESGVVGGGFLLSSFSSIRMGFSAEPHTSKSSKFVGEKRYHYPV